MLVTGRGHDGGGVLTAVDVLDLADGVAFVPEAGGAASSRWVRGHFD